MAKILGKIPNPVEDNQNGEPLRLTPEEMTPDQIIALAKYTGLLQEENKNLKGYIVQLQAQLQKARGDRAVAEHTLAKAQVIPTEIHIKSAFDEQD
jgi:dTDP-4-dehydrorhamnose reductase